MANRMPLPDWQSTCGTVRLYLADSKDLASRLHADCVVSDPPYGVNFKYGLNYIDKGGAEYASIVKVFDGWRAAILQYPEDLVAKIVPVLGNPDELLAWCYPSNLARQFRLWGLWRLRADFSQVLQPARNPECGKVKNKMVQSYDWWVEPQVKNVSKEKTGHPCQVPVSCVTRILRLIQQKHVLDPFMGSGTTGVAAVRQGLRFTGVEIEPEYFEIAVRRISDELNRFPLFETRKSRSQDDRVEQALFDDCG